MKHEVRVRVMTEDGQQDRWVLVDYDGPEEGGTAEVLRRARAAALHHGEKAAVMSTHEAYQVIDAPMHEIFTARKPPKPKAKAKAKGKK